MKPSISVAMNVRNEAARLELAIRSVRSWTDEIVVVDMESEDATRAIAERLGARCLSHPAVGFADPARALACAAATGDWVLVLDADELVPEPLSRRLREIAERGQVDAVRLPRQNHLLGAPLRHTGWDPERDRPLRFFRRGRATAPRGIHRHYEPVPGARVLDLRAEPGAMLVHFNYVDVSQFLEKLDRYTSIEADEAPAGEAPGALRVLGGALRELIARYVVHRGFADGWRGLYLSLFMSGYRLVVGAKRTERARVGDRAAVERRYRDEALRILAGYGGR